VGPSVNRWDSQKERSLENRWDSQKERSLENRWDVQKEGPKVQL
jgi:hypothetical protein